MESYFLTATQCVTYMATTFQNNPTGGAITAVVVICLTLMFWKGFGK